MMAMMCRPVNAGGESVVMGAIVCHEFLILATVSHHAVTEIKMHYR